MRIGATGFFPYIYNANMLQAGSLSRVSAIGDDLTKAGTDYSYLTDASLNINPLGRRESANLFDILDMQMQMSRRNASRVMATEEIPGEQIPDLGMEDQSEEILSLQYDRNLYQIQRAAEAYRVQML